MDPLYAMRHSLAHIMATAIQGLWPEAKFGVGPPTDNGFYYDIDLGDYSLTPEDLNKLDIEMHKEIKANHDFKQSHKKLADALKWARESNQDYKVELLNDLKSHGTTSAKDIDAATLGIDTGDSKVDEVSFFTNGDFTDLCQGPHVASTGKVGAFKLEKLAGAYWRGNEKNKMLQRIYGVAFATKQELDEYLRLQEEAKRRDHRKLGKELDLFTFSDLVGAGLPLYTPKGAIIRNKLKEMLFTTRRNYGGLEVSIPHIAKIDLYQKSGHAEKFEEELFTVKGHYGDFALKPVNCPHHIQIYNSKPRSYRDLPLPYVEFTTQYRDEKPGQIGGLSRVRGFTVDDGHTFCTVDQIKPEVENICNVIREFYSSIGMYGDHWVSLSLRDPATPEKYIGKPEGWDKAEAMLREISEEMKLDAKPMEGEAALYGPKLDFMFKDATGHDIQLSTIQLDFATPGRFNLAYVDEKGEEQPPVIIHSAIAGSFERFMVVLIEKLGGHFPFWLAPEQVRILTINDEVKEYVADLCKTFDNVVLNTPLKYNELRYSVDDRNESLGKKIREAETQKIPAIIVVGPRDVKTNSVNVRTKAGEKSVKLSEIADYLTTLT